MKKVEKPMFVDNLRAELESSTCVVLVDYAGLTVKMQQDLKAKLSEVGAGMSVVKNTLLKIAATNANFSKEFLSDELLSGPTALIITEGDPIAPLQILSGFAKNYDIPQFKVGMIEGKTQDRQSLLRLSSLPSKDVLSAMAIGAISAPLYGIVGVLNANMGKLVYILKQAGERPE
jgi:large subunit ribosomal protein L10